MQFPLLGLLSFLLIFPSQITSLPTLPSLEAKDVNTTDTTCISTVSAAPGYPGVISTGPTYGLSYLPFSTSGSDFIILGTHAALTSNVHDVPPITSLNFTYGWPYFSFSSSGSDLIIYGTRASLTLSFPTPWSAAPSAVEWTFTTTYPSQTAATTQSITVYELGVNDPSLSYTITIGLPSQADQVLSTSSEQPLETDSSMSMAPSSTSIETAIITSFVLATSTAYSGGDGTNSVSTSTSKAAAPTFVAGVGALLGVALGVVAVL